MIYVVVHELHALIVAGVEVVVFDGVVGHLRWVLLFVEEALFINVPSTVASAAVEEVLARVFGPARKLLVPQQYLVVMVQLVH